MLCDGASPTIESCTFADNALIQSTQGAGINCIDNSSIRLTGCTFLRNNAHAGDFGGGIYCQSSTATITGCVFRENSGEGGGGVAAEYYSSLFITDCDFESNESDNYGGSGVGCYLFSSATIATSRFFDNHGRDALMCDSGTIGVTSCTFVANDFGYPEPSSAQVECWGGQLTMENTIIAFGSGAAVICGAANATLVCCDLFGNQGGDWNGCVAGQLGVNGNFAADPRFCNLLAGDLTLEDDSPCMPGHHPQGEDCGLIGALGRGCGTTAVDEATWGSIKASFAR